MSRMQGEGLFISIYSITIEVSNLATDPNRLNGVDWRDKYSRFEKVKREIFLLTRGKTPETPLTDFQIDILRKGPKSFDWDNLVASLKPAIDGLTQAGIIFDDSWEYVKGIGINQEISKTENMLIITVKGTSDGRIPKVKKKRVTQKRTRKRTRSVGKL